jgi:ATP-dependent RNA helicase RhlE
VSHVINFSIPNVAEDYIHRIGRTGRAEREGVALSLMSDAEAPLMRDIERLMGHSVSRFSIEGEALPPEAARPARSAAAPRRSARYGQRR